MNGYIGTNANVDLLSKYNLHGLAQKDLLHFRLNKILPLIIKYNSISQNIINEEISNNDLSNKQNSNQKIINIDTSTKQQINDNPNKQQLIK